MLSIILKLKKRDKYKSHTVRQKEMCTEHVWRGVLSAVHIDCIASMPELKVKWNSILNCFRVRSSVKYLLQFVS